jgi:hypothetical protein
VDDEHLMPAEMQRQLLTVIRAINAGKNIHAAVGAEGPAAIRDVSTILRILRLPDVHFRHSEEPDVVLARILNLLRERFEKPSLLEIRDDGYW